MDDRLGIFTRMSVSTSGLWWMLLSSLLRLSKSPASIHRLGGGLSSVHATLSSISLADFHWANEVVMSNSENTFSPSNARVSEDVSSVAHEAEIKFFRECGFAFESNKKGGGDVTQSFT